MSFLSALGRQHGASHTARRISEAFTFAFGDLRHTLGCQPLCLSPGGPAPRNADTRPPFPFSGFTRAPPTARGAPGGTTSQEQRVGSKSSGEAGGPRAAHAHGEPVREPRRVCAGAPSTLCVLGAPCALLLHLSACDFLLEILDFTRSQTPCLPHLGLKQWLLKYQLWKVIFGIIVRFLKITVLRIDVCKVSFVLAVPRLGEESELTWSLCCSQPPCPQRTGSYVCFVRVSFNVHVYNF